MYNKTIIVGRISKNIELKYLPNGTELGIFDLASSKKYKNSQGQQVEDTLFIEVNVFGKQAQNVFKYTEKGSLVLVDGYLKLKQWSDKNGYKKSKIILVAEKVVFLGMKKNNQQTQTQEQNAPLTKAIPQEEHSDIPSDIPDDYDSELPF